MIFCKLPDQSDFRGDTILVESVQVGGVFLSGLRRHAFGLIGLFVPGDQVFDRSISASRLLNPQFQFLLNLNGFSPGLPAAPRVEIPAGLVATQIPIFGRVTGRYCGFGLSFPG